MERKYAVAVVTSTRADFGLLLPVLRRLQSDKAFSLRLVVTGAHLVPALGNTIDEITVSGIPVAEAIDIFGDDLNALAYKATARALDGFADYFMRTDPDLVLVLGDRYEIFAAAAAAAMCDVPVAHIAGGETTAGAKDEFFRHCITKMSALHFTAAEAYRRRVIQLGEQPDSVFFVGSLGAENIMTLPVIPPRELSDSIGFDCGRPFLLCTYHPETLGGVGPRQGVSELLLALGAVGMPCLFTAANADDGGTIINEGIENFCTGDPDYRLVKSLGAVRYLSAMRCCAAVVGNSSSAVVESPTLRKPSVNIGDRQKGRIMGANTISCPCERGAIRAAIERAVSPAFADSIRDMESPYGKGDASRAIVETIRRRLPTLTPKKDFYDIDFEVKA
ncbi:MAG: UDP-N-acetylglucosamine 2-epimerase [Oscillospiraceae bacterium]|nr:UDP-N-acetylglucosamine 2-epimerase [Oscillospiraceae bacterium]